ncbi:hypothetical protein B0H14DRAFT_2578490 [Mycena olivaceomarginata]|nr:hypothetical protein B0H14DRAFT_2578490 [Mycena olivaceomarginata]
MWSQPGLDMRPRRRQRLATSRQIPGLQVLSQMGPVWVQFHLAASFSAQMVNSTASSARTAFQKFWRRQDKDPTVLVGIKLHLKRYNGCAGVELTPNGAHCKAHTPVSVYGWGALAGTVFEDKRSGRYQAMKKYEYLWYRPKAKLKPAPMELEESLGPQEDSRPRDTRGLAQLAGQSRRESGQRWLAGGLRAGLAMGLKHLAAVWLAIEEGGLGYSELEGLNFDIPHGTDRAMVSKNKGKREGDGGRGRALPGVRDSVAI